MTADLLTEQDLEALPDPVEGHLDEVREAFTRTRHKVIVIDDDPTGTQTTSGASLIATWAPQDIEWLMRQLDDIGFILTNSRSVDEEHAANINRTIGARLRHCADRLGIEPLVISRSDSTLRGHFPAENQALTAAGGFGKRGTLVVPFFAEGGRITVNAVHYVRTPDGYVPAATTPFAKDAAFSYQNSDLRAWVEEKSAGAIPSGEVVSISVDVLRRSGPDGVVDTLHSVPPGGVCVVDAVTYEDLEVFMCGLYRAGSVGSWIFRSAASVVPTLAGRKPSPPVSPPAVSGRGGGLVVVGSHVPLTSRQLDGLRSRLDPAMVEIDAAKLADDGPNGEATAEAEVSRVRAQVDNAIGCGDTVVVYTSRDVLVGADPLTTSRRVADGLCQLVSTLESTPGFLVAKGGITSHTLAVNALGARRARVLGPIIPGVPMWEMGQDTRHPGLPYVVFPGNVGDEGALADAVERLGEHRK